MRVNPMRFNPNPRIERVPILPGQDCWVIDEVLLEPEALVERAVAQRAAFRDDPGNAYPGIEQDLVPEDAIALDDFFARHLRAGFGVRRTLRMYARLALVTRPPQALQPRQWICHRDRLALEPGRRVLASVLYLFHDESLGGTSFFRPLRSERETAVLVHASGVLPPDAFSARSGLAPGYPVAGNAWFEKLLTIPPRWNRLIVYDGMLFHAGDIRTPERLSDDPRRGRLTLNGFWTCRLAAA